MLCFWTSFSSAFGIARRTWTIFSRLSRGLVSTPLLTCALESHARLETMVSRSAFGRAPLQAIRPTRPQLAPEQIEVLLEDTLTLLKQEVQNRNINIEIERPDTLPLIKVDGGQIKQVFFNIIRNAFQAMPDSGQLKIVLFTTDEYLGISFRDSGVGISPEEFSRIFEPYHTTKSSGSGLGLMIVQRIVQEHGGQIELMSKPDTGTGFTVLLPLADRAIRLLDAQPTRGKGKDSGPLGPQV